MEPAWNLRDPHRWPILLTFEKLITRNAPRWRVSLSLSKDLGDAVRMPIARLKVTESRQPRRTKMSGYPDDVMMPLYGRWRGRMRSHRIQVTDKASHG